MNTAEGTERTRRREWEEKLITDYYDYRWRRIIDPLCDKMQRWKDGNLTYAEMEETLEEVHEETCEVRSLFRQRRDRLVNLIQHWDREWFDRWVEENRRPRESC